MRERIGLWNVYNRVGIQYVVPTNPAALEPVPNPHFTFHPAIKFHLKSDQDRASKDEATNSRECRAYFCEPDIAHGDATGWLRWWDSNSEMSSQNIPLKGRIDFQGSTRILATETIRV